MAQGPRYHVPFRRRREGKTDYRARLALVRSGKPRAVVRRSLSGTTVQLVSFHEVGDRVLIQASFTDLKKLGWQHSLKDTSASYLVGLLAAVKAQKADISEAVLDIGLHEPTVGNRVFAALKGLIDGGMDIPHGEGIFPDEGRLAGEHREEKGFSDDFGKMKSKILEM
ncbi:MAG: 50S ribosomal protein L18 [Candidatus Thermoplasmatota archaeon]|nr:50S ribosomal protein L18 [Candidatus Thermoplasmatota archaeon]